MEVSALGADLESLRQYRGRLHTGASVLLACLDLEEKLQERLDRVYSYANLNLATDGANPSHQAAAGRVQPLMVQAAGHWAAIQSELLLLPDGYLEQCLASLPGLEGHRGLIMDVLSDKPYALSPEAEKAVAALGDGLALPYRIFQRGTTADMTFDAVQSGSGETESVTIGGFLMHTELSPDTALRRRSWESLGKGLSGYQNIMAESLGTFIRNNVALSRLRKYDNVFHMLLNARPSGPRMFTGSDSVPVSIFEQVLDTILTELAPVMRRYARLRKQVLGLDKLLLCDLQAALPAGVEPRLSYEQGADWIRASTAVLGAEYQELINQAFDDRWIDRADNAGRIGGAFCNPVSGTHPFVFSTWTGGFRALFILAHELGHAGHTALSQRYQRLNDNRHATFFIETPSTLNELLLARYIRNQSEDLNIHRRVIMSLLATYHHNFVTHLLEAELLRRLYRKAEAGEPLTAKVFGDETVAMLGSFWGDEVELDEIARLNWMRQPHYYSGLYPYTYSVGLAGATVIAGAIEREGEAVVERYLEVLKAGSTRKPLDLFRMMGIDMTSPEPLRLAVSYVGSLVADLEATYR
ncbi:MAG: M3 family metallopeptidase [Bacillota bacterium]